jgi:hypothetical protein
MGSGGYSRSAWTSFSTSRKYDDPKTTVDDVYASKGMDPDLDPKNFSVRESVDGDDNPNSTPLIIGLDVTGSMAAVLDAIARQGLKTICEEVYNRKPITDPHICALGIGDVEWDQYPFQATQFEADIRINEQLEKIYLERGGGGNDHESYILAWYFAKFRTKTDSFTKRGVKGSIFTIGDEEITPKIHGSHFEKFMGDGQMRAYTAQELFDLVYPEWNVFHLIIKQGSHARSHYEQVRDSWAKVIGDQHVISVEDHEKCGEIIVSILEMMTGKSIDEVANSWDGSTAIEVKSSLKQLTSGDISVVKPLDSVL